jgi:3-dehydroquinate synthase
VSVTSTVDVAFPDGRSYVISIGDHLLDDTSISTGVSATHAVVITENNIACLGTAGPLIRTIDNLKRRGLRVDSITFAGGEDRKNLALVIEIMQQLYAIKGIDRKTLLVAVGGGVIGDIVGFVASIYLRGLPFLQVPTTLLAMVDSSVGGKTGVDFEQGKNLVGAFIQPSAVWVDTSVLATLPHRELAAGMAEVIKYGVIGDAALFRDLESAAGLHSLEAVGADLLQTLLERSAAAKARVVAADELEGGLRAILNYGHTLGHVVETLSGYGTYLHGEAVAIGMLAAGELALAMGLWDASCQVRQRALVEAAGLPVRWPDLDPEAVIQCLQADKKVRDGRVRFVLPTAIGTVMLRDDVEPDRILQALVKLT